MRVGLMFSTTQRVGRCKYMSMLGTMSCYLALDGDVIKTALLNTVLGMGIVFVVLILIAFIISLFGYIPKLLAKKEQPAKTNETPVVATVENIEEEVEEDLVDDTELVAVITAAIMASMGDEAPADGLIVRSIRRTNRKKFA